MKFDGEGEGSALALALASVGGLEAFIISFSGGLVATHLDSPYQTIKERQLGSPRAGAAAPGLARILLTGNGNPPPPIPCKILTTQS
jgi:hypothetical protein